MTTTRLPDWIANVPLKTVGVLCATHIFGKNIETRHMVLAGRRYFHNAVENVAGYVLNPILPSLPPSIVARDDISPEAAIALRNIRDCFNYIFHIQIEYFKILQRLKPARFLSRRTGVELNLNTFSAKSPTLINSEKRYLVLSKIDGAQPYDLDLDWNAEFDWVDDNIRRQFRRSLAAAQDAYAGAIRLGEWYARRERNLILPLKTIMDNLSEYFEHLGLAAYLMARNGKRRSDITLGMIRENLEATCRHLERFALDMLRLNVFSIVKHDLEHLNESDIDAVIGVRAGDDSNIGQSGFQNRHEEYSAILHRLYQRVGFAG